MYLYRAVDSEGNTIDFYLSKNENEAINKKKKSVIISAKNDNTRLLTDEQKITYVILETA
jgi:transposase, IS6 family